MTKPKRTAAPVQNQGGAALAAALEAAGSGAQSRLDAALGKGGGYVSHVIAGRFKPGYAGRLKIARIYKVAGALWDIPAVTGDRFTRVSGPSKGEPLLIDDARLGAHGAEAHAVGHGWMLVADLLNDDLFARSRAVSP